MWEIEWLRSNVCTFAKHEGEIWYEVIQRDRRYVQWLLDNNESLDEETRACLTYGVQNVRDR